jgi:hypothetical protein
MRPPCKDCPDRHIGCHSKCEKYLAFRRERDAYNEKHAMEVAILGSMNKRIADTNRKANKRRK